MVKTKQVEIMRASLSTHSTNIFDDIEYIKKAAIEKVSFGGYTNPTYMIQGTMEPYEDWPGDPEIVVYAHRPLTEKEVKEDAEEERLHKEAKQLGITFFEMKQLDNLRKRGVV